MAIKNIGKTICILLIVLFIIAIIIVALSVGLSEIKNYSENLIVQRIH